MNSAPVGNIFVPDPLLRPLVPLDAIAFYLGKLLVPLHLVMDYGRTPYSIAGKPAVRITCLIALTVITTVSGATASKPNASVTTSWNVKTVGVTGDGNVGETAKLLLRATAVPPICVQ